MELHDRLLTVRQFAEECKGQWPTSESTIRALILDASWGKNNFQTAFKRIGRRVLVDPKEFWKCVNRPQNGK